MSLPLSANLDDPKEVGKNSLLILPSSVKRSSVQWAALVKMVYLPDLSALGKQISSEDRV
jgi:hypothetical protein